MLQVMTGSREENSRIEESGEERPHLILCESQEVRVSEIVGELAPAADVTAKPAGTVHSGRGVKPVRFGGLRLDWYDCGVVLLIVASFGAAVLCLLGK